MVCKFLFSSNLLYCCETRDRFSPLNRSPLLSRWGRGGHAGSVLRRLNKDGAGNVVVVVIVIVIVVFITLGKDYVSDSSSFWQIIEIMGDRVGIPLKAVVKRSLNSIITLTVLPEESNPDM